MIGLIFLVFALLYEAYALAFDKQTISAAVWKLLSWGGPWARSILFFFLVWVTIHFFWPNFLIGG